MPFNMGRSVPVNTGESMTRSPKSGIVAFDIVHPAQLLFYYWPIKRLQQKGVECRIFLRKKDILLEIADALGLEYTTISTAGRGLLGLFSELIVRDVRLALACIRRRPNVLAGFGGVAASHVGTLLRIPVLVFYDSEHATLQNSLSYPFVTRLFVPESYVGPTPKRKTRRFPGTKECSYLDPKSFEPETNELLAFDFYPSKKTILFRLVEWRANHDIGFQGMTDDEVRRIIDLLPANTQIFISSERSIPTDLEVYRWQGPPLSFHHLVANADLVISESATVCQESAILSTTNFYISPIKPLVTRWLDELGLIKILDAPEINEELLRAAIEETPASTLPAECFHLQDLILENIDELGFGSAGNLSSC